MLRNDLLSVGTMHLFRMLLEHGLVVILAWSRLLLFILHDAFRESASIALKKLASLALDILSPVRLLDVLGGSRHITQPFRLEVCEIFPLDLVHVVANLYAIPDIVCDWGPIVGHLERFELFCAGDVANGHGQLIGASASR